MRADGRRSRCAAFVPVTARHASRLVHVGRVRSDQGWPGLELKPERIILGIPVLVLAIAVSIAFAVLPVMFAARFVGAGRTTFGWVLLAVVVQGVVSGLLNGLVTNFLVTSPGMAGPLGASSSS